MRLATNISAMQANNALQRAQTALSQSINRLSSGYKINSSKDDAAGCAISEKMRSQIRGLNQADNNASDGISVLQTAEGALSEIQSMLSRIKELAVQAANDVNSDDERSAIQAEIDQINAEIDRISDDTEFNTQSLINGSLQRKVYSNYSGVNQLSITDSFVDGNYGITVTEDARQAVAVAESSISMSDSDTIAEDEAGTISVNGYKIDIAEGDSLADVMDKIVSGFDTIGGKAFVVDSTTNDTKTNGTEYAGYVPSATSSYSGKQLVMMTSQYGSEQKYDISCDNQKLADLLGISSAASDEGIHVEGSDVKAEFTLDSDGNRIGFANSAVITTKGTEITVSDVNNKSFVIDVPGNVAATVFDDTYASKVDGKSQAGSSVAADIVQEATDAGTMSIHIGANENQVIILDIPEITTYTLKTDNINVMTNYTASQAIETVDEAINKLNEARSKIGAYQNRFDHTESNLGVSVENLTSALSSLIDTDMASEMTEYTSQTVITQAATSILSQANERPSEVLQLLQ